MITGRHPGLGVARFVPHIATKIRKAMDLTGLDLKATGVTLKPGEYTVLRQEVPRLKHRAMRFRLAVLLALLLGGTSHAQLSITQVVPDRIYYVPNEEVRLDVAVVNTNTVAEKAVLQVNLVRDLVVATPLSSAEISVAAGQTNSWTFTWKAQPWIGIEALATLSRDGQELAARSEYFTCARTVHQVFFPLQFPNITGNFGMPIEKYAAGMPAGYRANYANAGEQFAWAPSDYDCLTPEVDRWWAGQGGYNTCKTNLLAMYGATRRLGIRVFTYGKAGGGGPITFEFLRKHPAYSISSDGCPTLENYDAAYLDFFEAIGPPKPEETCLVPLSPADMEKKGYAGAGWYKPYTPGLQNWCAVWYDSNNDAVLKHGCDELGKSALMFGFDGVRFDGEFATRFAVLLWDDTVHGWDQAERMVEVKSDRDLWWKPFAAVRPAPEKGTQYIIHLINPPEWKTTLGPKGEPPSPPPPEAMPAAAATNVVVRLKDTGGFRRAFVADLDRCDLQEIPLRKESGQAVLRVPEIKHWSILVIDRKGRTPEMVWTSTKEEANLKTPTAQDLQIAAPAAGTRDRWHVTLQAEDAYPNPRGVTDLVKELDAKGGASVHCQPGRPAWYLAVGQYIYPSIPGEHVARYRLKVSDNTIDKPVAVLSVDHAMEPIPGIQALNTPRVVLKGTDFKQPNVYQEFAVPFKHPDIGYHGTTCIYGGNGEIWLDQITVDLVKPWTNEDLAGFYAPFKPPREMKLRDDGKLNVLLVRGVWNRLYRLDDVVAKLPNVGQVDTTYASYHFQRGLLTTGVPIDWEPVFQHNVMVLANFEARALPMAKERIIQKWVEEGGRLVILGGLLTLGQAYNMDRGWPDMLPVELNPPNEIRECSPPVRLGKADPALGLTASWGDQPPVVMYRHVVKPKADAKVLLAGDHDEPLLVGGAHGKGRVVVFAGTVLGEAPAGETGFWQSPGWPDVLAAAIRWTQAR